MSESLVELARGFCTDKGTTHSYLEVYEALVGARRERVAGVLELGVQEGGSLGLWEAYFPRALVVGVDVLDCTRFSRGRVRVLHADAYDHETVRRAREAGPPGGYDLIVDDGPHTLDSLVFAARHYAALLAEGGVLVLEDVQDPGWTADLCGAAPELAPEVIDRRGVKGRYDDIMVVYRRPPRPEPEAP